MSQPTDTTPPSPQALWSLLRNRSFLCLWLAQVLSQLADRIVYVVFISYIVTSFHANSERNTSYLYIAFTIPAVLLTAVAGVFVDRWSRRLTLTLTLTNVTRGLLVLLLPSLGGQSLGGLFTLAFLLSCATQFFVPAESATIPSLVSKTQLVAANSLFTTTLMASVIFGFALGDPLLNLMGLDQVHWGLAALFFGAAALLVGVKLPPKAPHHGEETTTPSYVRSAHPFIAFFQEMREGFTFIQTHSVVWQAMAKLALLFSAVVALCILCISFAKSFLYSDPTLAARKFAYLIAFAGVGMALGAVKLPFALHYCRKPTLVYSGMMLVGLGLVGLASVPALVPAAYAPVWLPEAVASWFPHLTQRLAASYGCAMVLGLGASMVAVPLQTVLHDRIPEALRGKVLGVQFTVLSTASTLPAVVAGLGTERFGVLPMLHTLALPFLLWGLLGGAYTLWRKYAHKEALPW